MPTRTPSAVVRSSAVTGDPAGYFFSQPLPAPELPNLDPFLLLHHHGPMTLPPDTRGMPFGPHPHRGFCTLTVILAGSVIHQDSHGFKSQIDGSAAAAGAQWMTAGRGLIHNESTPKEFNETGGPLELLQLWINLPARLKLTPAHYEGLPPARVGPQALGSGGATVQLFTGGWPGLPAAYAPVTNTVSALLRIPAGAALALPAPAGQAVLLYVLRGKPTIGGHDAKPRVLLAFDAAPASDAETIALTTPADPDETLVFYVAGEPLREPVVQHGPFVMNSEKEIMEAMRDYQMGKMGVFIEE